MTQDEPTPDDFQEFLRRMLGGAMPGGPGGPQGFDMSGFDLSALSGNGPNGMPFDPAQLAAFMQQLQGAFSTDPWESALRQALHVANQDGQGISTGAKDSLVDAFALATLWLSEATALAELSTQPRAMTRGEWVEASLPVWREVAQPVSTSIADALTDALGTHAPDDVQGLVAGAGQLMRGLGASVFAMQFGRVLGGLALEVVSGGDVGIPVLPAGTAAVIPQNIATFGEGLELADDQLTLYLATRELAYARLYRHARWLHLHVLSQITEFARGVEVDVDALDDLANRIDPTNMEQLQEALNEGTLLPALSALQREALERLENLIALIDGWVDVVTATATARLPQSARIAEAARRRRAEGGPAEDALGALVGLRLRPRRLREAAAMWQAVTDAVGVEARDALWDYPDLMPTADNIDNPDALIARLQARARGEEPQPDEMDEALARLLSGEDFGAPTDSGSPEAPPTEDADPSTSFGDSNTNTGDGKDNDGDDENPERPV